VRRLFFVSAIVAIGVLARGVGAQPAAPNVRFGMNTRVLTPQMADTFAELGAGVVRLAFGWDVIEPNCKGCYNWSTTDAWRDEARRTGRTIFASLAYVPGWANGGRHYEYPPIDFQNWYDFVFATVSRYRTDIFVWGIWNEPNLDIYLNPPDLRTYRTLAILARAAIRAANPLAIVLGPDVSWHGVQSGWFAAAMNDFGDLFDVVTVHWYADGPDLEHFMDDLVRPASLGKPVWLSETGMQPCFSIFGETGQALFYNRVLQAFLVRRAWWTGVSFYDLHDDPAPGTCGSGITRDDWSSRPAFQLYQRVIRANP